MTGYYIETGYCSQVNEKEQNRWLENIVNNLDLEKIKEIAIDLGVNENVAREYIERYEKRNDLTIKTEIQNGKVIVSQLASGGGEERRYKEKMRIAVAIYLLMEAAKVGINLNFYTS